MRTTDERLNALHEQIDELHLSGEFSGATPLCKELYEHCEVTYGAHHPTTISALLTTARSSHFGGTLIAALDLYLDARVRIERAFYPGHPLYVDTYRGMAEIYMEQHLYLEAHEFFDLALKVLESCGGSISRDAALLQLRSGDALSAQGNHELARNTYGQALTILADLEFDALDLRVKAALKLGLLSSAEGRNEQAIGFFEEALHLNAQLDVPLLSMHITILKALASSEESVGNAERALVLRREVISLLQGVNPVDLSELKAAQLEAISVCEATRNFAAAEELYEELLNFVQSESGSESIEAGRVRQQLGEIACITGNYALARTHLSAALNIYVAAFGEQDPRIGHILHNLGTVSLAQEALDEAELYLGRAVTILGEDVTTNPESSRPLIALATLQLRRDNTDRASEILNQVLALGDDQPEDVLLLRHQAELMLQDINGESSAETTIVELEPDSANPVASTADMAEVGKLFNAALLAMNKGSYAEAAQLFDRTLKILESNQGENHPDLVPILDNIALVYDRMGLTDRAAGIRLRSQQLRS